MYEASGAAMRRNSSGFRSLN